MDTSPLQNPTKPCRAKRPNVEIFCSMGPLNNIIIERETTLYLNLWLMMHEKFSFGILPRGKSSTDITNVKLRF